MATRVLTSKSPKKPGKATQSMKKAPRVPKAGKTVKGGY